MGVGAGHGVQLAPVRLHHHHARSPGRGGDVPQRPVGVALRKIDLVDGLPCPQGFDHGVATLDYAVRFRGQRVFLLIVHKALLRGVSAAAPGRSIQIKIRTVRRFSNPRHRRSTVLCRL